MTKTRRRLYDILNKVFLDEYSIPFAVFEIEKLYKGVKNGKIKKKAKALT